MKKTKRKSKSEYEARFKYIQEMIQKIGECPFCGSKDPPYHFYECKYANKSLY